MKRPQKTMYNVAVAAIGIKMMQLARFCINFFDFLGNVVSLPFRAIGWLISIILMGLFMLLGGDVARWVAHNMKREKESGLLESDN